MKILNKNIFLWGTIMVGITSCTVSRKYTRADAGLPNQYRDTVMVVTSDTLPLSWRVYFKDPQLVGLIEKALEKNNDIAIALKNMEQLDLAVKQARHGLLPTLDLNASASRTWQSKNSLNGSLSGQFISTSYLDDYNAGLRLQWEVDIWQKAKMQKDIAKAEYFAQKENLIALRTRIISQVAQAYFNLISLDEQLRIAQQNIVLSDSTLHVIYLQYQSGQINSLALNQAEAQKRTAELLVPLAIQNIAIQENALSILCGGYPNAITRAGSLDAQKPETVFTSGVPAALISRRPDVKAAELAVIGANARTGLAKAAMYPSFSLSAQGGVNSFKFSQWFDLPGSITKNLAANLTQPLFQKRSLKTAYETAVLEQDKAVIQFRQSVMTAVGEVSDAMAQNSGATERLKLVKEKAAALDKATHDALLLYKSGMANYLEVITAQNNKLQNDLEGITIKREQLYALTDLYRSLGGGVEN